MDKIDRRILAALQADGNIANLELADKVGLSPSPCVIPNVLPVSP